VDDEASPDDVTVILNAASRGDAAALDQLVPLLYGELRQVARRAMARTPPGQSLQPTALVHEAWIRLVGKESATWENRRHFFFAAARAMHDVLVERARARASARRGGDLRRVELDDAALPFDMRDDDVIALGEALERLGRSDPERRRLVELRFFAGLSAQETADVLGVSLSTVERDWRFVKAKLHAELSSDQDRRETRPGDPRS
jgi:RNA polymerase sigma factor (TIGR02999 family)